MTKKFNIKIWWIAAIAIIITFAITNGGILARTINSVDTFIFFIWFEIVFLSLSLVITSIVRYHFAGITSLPDFLTKNFLTEQLAEYGKEKMVDTASSYGIEKHNDKIEKLSKIQDKFSILNKVGLLALNIGALFASYDLINTYSEGFENNLNHNSLLILVIGFIAYYFFKKIK